MDRLLTARVVQVQAARQGEWLAVMAELELAARASGRHKWVFRHPVEPGLFLEFDEGPADAPPVQSAHEASLAGRAACLADYSKADPSQWIAVPLGAAPAQE